MNRIFGTLVTSSRKYLQNINISIGVSSKVIRVEPGLTYETQVGFDSSGVLVIKNPFD